MLNNMKKIRIYLIIIVSLMTFAIQSCTEENEAYKCTIYLNGNVWSENAVSDCSLCTAPQGYTTTCN